MRTISNMRFGPHDWHLVEMPHFAWIWISLQSSFMVPLPIFAEFSNPNIHLFIVPVKGIGKAPIILKLPSLSTNWTKTCPKSSSGKIPHFKRHPLKKERDLSNQRYYYVILLVLTKRRNTVVQQKAPFYWLQDTDYYGKLTLAAAEKNWPLRTDSSPSWMQEVFLAILQKAAEFTVHLCQSAWQQVVLLAISFPRDLLVKRFNSQNPLFSHLLLAPEL